MSTQTRNRRNCKKSDQDPSFGSDFEAAQGFTIVYNAFVDRHMKYLSRLEALAYITLCRFAGARKEAWPSYGTMANLMGASRSSVIRAIQSLVDRGLVKVQSRERENGSSTSNLYLITDIQKDTYKQTSSIENETGGGVVATPGWCRGDTRGSVVATPPEEEHINKKHTTLRPGNPDAVRECDFGFDLNEKSPEQIIPENKVRSAVNKLYEAIASKRLLRERPSLIGWEATIRNLLDKITMPEEDFYKSLEWYCEHIGEEFVPVACSAKSFSKKFEQIYNAWERREMRRPAEESEHAPKKLNLVFRESTMTEEEFEAYLATI